MCKDFINYFAQYSDENEMEMAAKIGRSLTPDDPFLKSFRVVKTRWIYFMSAYFSPGWLSQRKR